MRISVEGNIGCGKSRLLADLARDWRVQCEPVEEWRDILPLFYANRQRWALAMNARALLSFADVPDSEPVVVERSPLSCKEVFGRMHKNEGVLSEKEWQLLSDLYERVSWVPDVIIYLCCPPATCLERVQRRGRDGEQDVTHDYLAKLQFAHLTMLRWYEGEMHAVDATQDAATVTARVRDILLAYRA